VRLGEQRSVTPVMMDIAPGDDAVIGVELEMPARG